MSTIPDYPAPARALTGEEPIAAWQDGQQIALPVATIIGAAIERVDPAVEDALAAQIAPLVQRSEVASAVAVAARDEAVRQAFTNEVTIGSVDGAGANSVAGGGTFGFGSHFLQRAVLIGAEIWTQNAGIIALRRAKLTTDADIHTPMGKLINFIVSAGGQHILSTADILTANGGDPFIMEPGELLVGGSSGGLQFDGSYEPYWSFPAGLGEGSSAALNLGALGATFKAKFTFQLAPRVPQHTPLRRYDRFSVVPANWINSSNKASADGNGALNLAVGDSNFTQQLVCPATIGLDRWSAEWEVSADATATELGFTTSPATPVDSGQFEGSMITLRWGVDGGQLCVFPRWTSGSPGTLDSADVFPVRALDGGPFLIPNRRYAVRMTELYRDYRVEVIGVDSPGYFSKLVSDNGWDGYKARAPQDTPLGNTHTKYGLMHGSPGIVALGAAAKLYSFRIDHDYADTPLLLRVGNSIYAGFGVPRGDRVADLLEADHGKLLVPNSGVGGMNSVGLIARLFFLRSMGARIVMIECGTNGGDDAIFAANMALAVRMIREMGATPVIETVPISASKTAIIRALGVQVIDIASVSRQNGAGSAAVDPFYALVRPDDGQVVYDRFHPNALSNFRNRAQIKRVLGI